MVAALSKPSPEVAIFEEYMYDWPERICVDTALDAERRGAQIRTYTKVTQIEKCNEIWEVTLNEQAPEMDGQVKITTKAIVNAGGPWVDRIIGGGKKRYKSSAGT
ncbi:FAD-dependent oxidoreductase [Acinetobacter vivianii]